MKEMNGGRGRERGNEKKKKKEKNGNMEEITGEKKREKRQR